MASFDKAVVMTLRHEGGYVNDPDDAGGETNFGISKRCFPDVDIKNLSRDQAKEIYKKHYWDQIRLTEVDNQYVADKIFDIAVNMGIFRAGEIVQEAINTLGKTLKVDGIIGKKTIQSINSIESNGVLLKIIIFLRIKFYISLVEKKGSQKKFLNGWITRA